MPVWLIVVLAVLGFLATILWLMLAMDDIRRGAAVVLNLDYPGEKDTGR
jgi:uncharacterized membrane protein YqiK